MEVARRLFAFVAGEAQRPEELADVAHAAYQRLRERLVVLLGQGGLSVSEIRRLLWKLAFRGEQTATEVLAWSRWRRQHQAVAKFYHYQATRRIGLSTTVVLAHPTIPRGDSSVCGPLQTPRVLNADLIPIEPPYNTHVSNLAFSSGR